MNRADVIKKIQDDEYSFPYHYVAQFRGDRFIHYFPDAWAINYASTVEYLLNKLSEDAPRSVVDIGCGDGRFTRELYLENPDTRVVGIDLSSKAISLARAMNSDYPEISFDVVDILRCSIEDRYDAAILMEVLEHIPEDLVDQFLCSVSCLMKNGGELYLTVPHENKKVEPKHFQHFSVKKIIKLLEVKFDIVEVVPFENKSIIGRMILNIMMNKIYILSNRSVLSWIYKYYKKHLFVCNSEESCQRIFVKAISR